MSSESQSESSSQRTRYSFLSRRRALANHVDTCVRVMRVITASMIFSPLDGYGFLMCSSNQVLSVVVDSRPRDLERATDDVTTSPLDDVTLKLNTRSSSSLSLIGVHLASCTQSSTPEAYSNIFLVRQGVEVAFRVENLQNLESTRSGIRSIKSSPPAVVVYTSAMLVPPYRLTTIGRHSFPVAASISETHCLFTSSLHHLSSRFDNG